MAIARGQITVVDLNDAKSMNMFLGSNQPLTQIFNKENSSYTPNYPTSNLVITPELYVSGTTTDVISRLKAAPTYTINGKDPSTFGGTVATTAPYALTIKNNMASVSQMIIVCSGVYVDSDTSLETPVKSQINYSKTENAGQLICAIGYAPNGNIFKNGEQSTLKAHCDMWRGSSIDTTNVSYQWYKLANDGTWETLASTNTYGITGTTTNEITIPASAVLNFESFKCTIKDTDSSSGSYNTTVSDILSFSDLSDPYVVEVLSTTGDKLVNGQGSTTITARVWQNGVLFSDDASAAKFVFTWMKYKADGSLDTAWGDTTNKTYTKTGATITATAAEISVKSTYIVELSLK
jgi:hypothetical protein